MQTAVLPPGALRLADLGYFAIPTLQTYEAQGVFWLMRYYTKCEVVDAQGVRQDLVQLLQTTPLDRLDLAIHLSATHRFPCRLIALRLVPEAAAVRLRLCFAPPRREGQPLSKKIRPF